jgi:hypothetical protein
MVVKVIGLDTAKNVFQVHWIGCKRASGVAKETAASTDTGFLRESTEVRGGDRGHPRRALLVARDRIVRPRGSANRPPVREAIFDRSEE